MTTPSQIYAGEQVTADQINAMSRFVSVITCDSVTDTETETIVGTVTIPATDAGLAVNGGYYLLWMGVVSCTGTPTLIIRVRMGSVTGANLQQYSNTCLSDLSDATATLRMEMLITAAGSSGTFSCVSQLISGIGATPTASQFDAGNALAINTTEAVTLVITAQWNAASTSNTATGTAGNLDRV